MCILFLDTIFLQFQRNSRRPEPRFWQSRRDEVLTFTNPLESVPFTKNIKNGAKITPKSLQKLIQNHHKIGVDF